MNASVLKQPSFFFLGYELKVFIGAFVAQRERIGRSPEHFIDCHEMLVVCLKVHPG